MNQKTHLRSFSHDVLGMARILDQKSNIWSKKQVEISQKSSEVGTCVGVWLEANQKRQRMYQKGISLHFRSLGDDISWSRDRCHIKTDQVHQFGSMFDIFFQDNRSISGFET
jgi:hypothetical protein